LARLSSGDTDTRISGERGAVVGVVTDPGRLLVGRTTVVSVAGEVVVASVLDVVVELVVDVVEVLDVVVVDDLVPPSRSCRRDWSVRVSASASRAEYACSASGPATTAVTAVDTTIANNVRGDVREARNEDGRIGYGWSGLGSPVGVVESVGQSASSSLWSRSMIPSRTAERTAWVRLWVSSRR
jgi:hypothetical protein